ncbi:MAG: endonuclease III [Syntrophorhabdaceae bacterium]|nr:endonuclease III [Syntrophorhabdaceae bacterium]
MKKEKVLFNKIVKTLKDYLKEKTPIITELAQKKNRDPFVVLVGTILSLRTRDETTEKAMERLFKKAMTPEDILKLTDEELERLIYPVGFYRNKTKTIKEVSKTIIEKYHGRVPDEIEELLKIKGIGRKTANLVITEGYGKPGICVDTHVHRISNRLGVIRTKNPHETEYTLRKILPKKYWIIYNSLLVTFGQNICKPISPHCTICPLNDICKKVGVTVNR